MCSQGKNGCGIPTSHFHCILCDFTSPLSNKTDRHLSQSHFKQTSTYEAFGIIVVPFKQKNDTKIKLFHCPKCHKDIVRAKNFEEHIRTHTKPNGKTSSKSNPIKQAPRVLANDEPPHASKAPRKNEQKECSHCNLKMHRSSLKRHIESQHKNIVIPKAFCVDRNHGIFLVKKSTHGGVPHYLHVQKLLQKQSRNNLIAKMLIV